jgi:hypothetical protein
MQCARSYHTTFNKLPTCLQHSDYFVLPKCPDLKFLLAAAVERGGKVHHLHMQCMLWCPKINRNRDAKQQAAHNMVYNFAGVPKGQNFHVYVELHWPGNAAHVTWRTMVGYASVTLYETERHCLYMFHVSYFFVSISYASVFLRYWPIVLFMMKLLLLGFNPDEPYRTLKSPTATRTQGCIQLPEADCVSHSA